MDFSFFAFFSFFAELVLVRSYQYYIYANVLHKGRAAKLGVPVSDSERS